MQTERGAGTRADGASGKWFQSGYRRDANCVWQWAAWSDGEVVLANSLGDAISPLVSTQLKQLYAHLVTADGGLEVRI